MNESRKKELERINDKIIQAVIEKSRRVCPNSLAMIGVYGSFLTGDIHEKSDLDLMIVINDDNGWQLSGCFIADGIGYDVYCTPWSALENDAEYNQPNISKLMNAKIVYCADEAYTERLEALRRGVRNIISAPFSAEDYGRARSELENAEKRLGCLMLTSGGELSAHLAMLLYHIENAVCLLNKSYYKMGVRRFYEEIERLSDRPENLRELFENALSAESDDKTRSAACELLRAVRGCFEAKRAALPDKREAPSAEILSGSYEESFSNWRNKMYLAAENNDTHASFSAMAGLQLMWNDMCEDARLPSYDLLARYNPADTAANARAFDEMLGFIAEQYRAAGAEPVIYGSVDDFVRAYLGE